MKKGNYRFLGLCFVLLLAVASGMGWAQQPPSELPPANVAGKWTIYSKGPKGTSTKTIELKQDGTVLSGHFKGPNQSGGIEGTIHERHIVFRTKTRYVLTFRGRVEGDRVQGVIEGNAIHGNFHDRAGTGEWQAVRAN